MDNLVTLLPQFSDEDKAREHLEGIRWPNGPVCPHCGAAKVYRLEAKPESKRPVRKGVWKCAECRKQFTVRVGTIFEDSHIPLSKWLMAFYLLCSSKKGMSAHQLHRSLGITYKSAWFMAHRIRYAMSQPPLSDMLSGVIEADETYVGGKTKGGKRGRGAPNKIPVFTLIERGGRARSFKMERVTADNLGRKLREHVTRNSQLMTDSYNAYRRPGRMFESHETVDHKAGEYVRGKAHVNSAEGYFSLLKRSIFGIWHHVSERHLHRYLAETDFRYSLRKVSDGERTLLALQATEGKRLTLREPKHA